METVRLEAFSDAVIAILITIMVLELKVPHGEELAVLIPMIPIFLAYVLSFVYLGIYWSNHHHMLHATHHIDGRMLLANLHLLFWLSLIPSSTAWMSENGFAPIPTAFYGVILFCSAFAFLFLQKMIILHEDAGRTLREAIGGDLKGKVSLIMYFLAVPLAFVHQWISVTLYVLVALLWIVPDRRIEKVLGH